MAIQTYCSRSKFKSIPLFIIGTALATTCLAQAQNSAPHSEFYSQVAESRGLGGAVGYGRGAAFADIDSDGDDDLFVADTDGRLFGRPFGMSMIYVNDGSGNFIPGEFNLDPTDFHGTWVGSFADYDNDGDPDLMVGNGGYTNSSTLVLLENRINQNQGFVKVNQLAGLDDEDGAGASSGWWGVSWADYDNDGWLDVLATRRQARPLLFHNEQNGTFVEVGEQLGLTTSGQRDAKNPLWIDYDQDGDQDLYIAGMDWHAFYRNDLDRFTDITEEIFVEALAGRSGLPAVFAAASTDFDQDGKEDIYLGRWDSQDYILFGNGVDGFDRMGIEAGLNTDNLLAISETDRNPMYSQTTPARIAARANGLEGESEDGIAPYENTMGLGVGDFYDDGYPDVVIGTGDPRFVAADVFFCNLGARRFERCTDRFIEPDSSHNMTRGHGAIFGDVNRDGFTDFYFNLGGHPPYDFDQNAESRETNKLFMRDTNETANAAWVTLTGTESNRDAIGARVRYGEGDLTRYHYLRSTQGFQSQNSMTLLLPLADQESAPVVIDWPSGKTTEISVNAGEHYNITEQ